MALILDDATCPLCGRPLEEREYFATTFVALADPAMAWLDDGYGHVECIREWPLRDAFVRAYNAAWGGRWPAVAVSRRGRIHDVGPVEGVLIWCGVMRVIRHRQGASSRG